MDLGRVPLVPIDSRAAVHRRVTAGVHLIEQRAEEDVRKHTAALGERADVGVVHLGPAHRRVVGPVEVHRDQHLGPEAVRPVDARLRALGTVLDRLAIGSDLTVTGEVVRLDLERAILPSRHADVGALLRE